MGSQLSSTTIVLSTPSLISTPKWGSTKRCVPTGRHANLHCESNIVCRSINPVALTLAALLAGSPSLEAATLPSTTGDILKIEAALCGTAQVCT